MKAICQRHPELKGYFDYFDFNPIQKACLPKIMETDSNLIVSAPTSSGKTVLFEMAILKYSHLTSPICLYLAPIKSLCHEKYNQWSAKFQSKLSIAQVTGDSSEDNADKYLHSHITIGTPQKVDFLSRQNLQFLKKINLLLIDQIHMLNFQQRGATLEAIVSRIMSLNSKVRIIAVSATIPNIHEVAEWLKVPTNSVCIFGDAYRPVKLNKVVLGFKNSGNPFLFQKLLNFKLLQAIRSYSDGKGSLVFCPTQKGTESACQQIIAQMRQRQFIQNDKQLLALIQAAKQVSNYTLQTMLPQGLAFHNASLSPQDRSIVQKLFLELKVKVLCTTSTLAMGINLPARLVVIKSTLCYRGSTKGYQEYSKIQIDQMLGRAGRPPFDTEGTVVIMTEKSNYNRYNGDLQLQNLQSQLFGQLLQHLNAQISLGSITCFRDVEDYLHNSFCYIRMKKSPGTYGVTGNLNDFIKQSCQKALQTLLQLNIINVSADSQRVSPKPLSNSISRSAVEVRSIALFIKAKNQITSQRQFLLTLCRCEEIGKYSSKVQERKYLKQINEKNKFTIKQAIANPERKSYVLIQVELSRRYIQSWELRRQASDILQMIKRLNYCVRTLSQELKLFWMYFWATKYLKYLTQKMWEFSDGQILLQFSGLQDKGKLLSSRGVKSIAELKNNISNIGTWLQKGEYFVNTIVNEIKMYEQSLKFKVYVDKLTGIIHLKIECIQNFNSIFRGITICIGDSKNNLYLNRYLNQKCKQIDITFPKDSTEQYKVGIIKDGIIGFDQFYLLKGQILTKFCTEIIELKPAANNRKSQSHIQRNTNTVKERKSKSHQFENTNSINKINKNSIKQISNYQSNRSRNQKPQINMSTLNKKQKQSQLPSNYRIRKPIEPYNVEEDYTKKQIKKIDNFRYKPLQQYNWKPGFEEISSQSSNTESKNIKMRSLMLVDKPSKYKLEQGQTRQQLGVKSKRRMTKSKSMLIDQLVQYQYKPEIDEPKKQNKYNKEHQDVFSYFYNLF